MDLHVFPILNPPPTSLRRGWEDLREQHRNMYIIKCETDRQSRLDAWDKGSGLVHWDDPEGRDVCMYLSGSQSGKERTASVYLILLKAECNPKLA